MSMARACQTSVKAHVFTAFPALSNLILERDGRCQIGFAPAADVSLRRARWWKFLCSGSGKSSLGFTHVASILKRAADAIRSVRDGSRRLFLARLLGKRGQRCPAGPDGSVVRCHRVGDRVYYPLYGAILV